MRNTTTTLQVLHFSFRFQRVSVAVRLSGLENASHSITRSVESPKCAAPCMSITALNKEES